MPERGIYCNLARELHEHAMESSDLYRVKRDLTENRDWGPPGSARAQSEPGHSTVTLLARLRGLSTSRPSSTARW